MPQQTDRALTRRSVLTAAAGGAALLATRGLPAWARPVASESGPGARLARTYLGRIPGGAGLRQPGSLPFPGRPEGTPTMPQIQHIVVLMMENHSFDNLLGMVPHQVPRRRSVDGFTVRHGRPMNFNPDSAGNRVTAEHAASPCQLSGEPSQSWNASHAAYDNGLNDGFVKASAPVAMRYWDKRDLPFTYSLAEHFPIGERHFASVLGQTFPNRSYLFAGTSSGMVNDIIAPAPPANGTIFDRLDAHHIDWRVYYQAPSYPSFELVPGADTAARAAQVRTFDRFHADVSAGRLPKVTFLDPNYETSSQEDPQDIQLGERYIAQVVHALMAARTWKHTALFVTYDEHGGYYDHVPPPAAIPPDSTAPTLAADDVPGAFDRYRLPRADDRGLTLGAPGVRLTRGRRPHLDHRVRRAQVEPAGDDLPRRQRPPDDRLLRLPASGVCRAAQACRAPEARPRLGEMSRGRLESAADRLREPGTTKLNRHRASPDLLPRLGAGRRA